MICHHGSIPAHVNMSAVVAEILLPPLKIMGPRPAWPHQTSDLINQLCLKFETRAEDDRSHPRPISAQVVNLAVVGRVIDA